MIKLPFIHQMQFEPVPSEQDELLQSIENDSSRQDDVWQLNEEIDPAQLDRFWDQTLHELKDEELDG